MPKRIMPSDDWNQIGNEFRKILRREPNDEELAAFVLLRSQRFRSIKEVNDQLRAFLGINEAGEPIDDDGKPVKD